jgi:GNAT superfamily N-acetyltransferase
MLTSNAIASFAEEPHHELPELPPPSRRFIRSNFTLGLSPAPTHAAVSRLRTTAADLDATISEVREILRAHAYVGCRWYLGPSSRPIEAMRLLMERGFTPAIEPPFEPTYAVMTLTRPPPSGEPSPGVESRLVDSYDEYARALRAGFKASDMADEDIASWMSSAPAIWEHESGVAQQTHIAFVDGQVAGFGFAAPGTVAVLLAGSAVLPAFRGRGAYRALVASRWLAAVAMGKPGLAIQAGAMSRPILARCGFEEICQLDVLTDPTLG